MAEISGLAIGATGLAGLFNNVIDCFEYVHIGNTFGGNFQTSLLKLDSVMLRLSRWGEAMGFSGSVRDTTALLAGININERREAEQILGQILKLFDNAGKEAAKFKIGKNSNDESLLEYNDNSNLTLSAKYNHQIMQGLCARRQNQTPLSQKVKFAVYSEKHLKQLIDDITDLTNDLVTLFPGKPEFGEDQKKLCSDEVREFTKSLRELAEAVKGNDKLLSAALSEILKPANSPFHIDIRDGHVQRLEQNVTRNEFNMGVDKRPTTGNQPYGGSSRELIQQTIQATQGENLSMYKLHCRVSWEIRQFCDSELSDADKLPSVVTLTGAPTEAQADSCEDFVQKVWETRDLLDWLVRALHGHYESCSLYKRTSVTIKQFGPNETKDSKYPEQANVVVQGPLDEVVRVIQQLAWFAAVFRLPTKDAVTISTAVFRKSEEHGNRDFEIVPWTIDSSTPMRDMSHAEVLPTCWHRLFHGTVLAYGFPISPRAAGKGVEIPFDLMVGLAAVNIALQRNNEGTVLIGHSIMLYVSDRLGDEGLQWHCAQVEDKDSARSLPSDTRPLNLKNLGLLSRFKTFLGYENAEVVLGTKGFPWSNPVGPSDLDEATRGIELAREGTFSFGLSIKSIFNGSIGGKWSIPKTQQVSLEDSRSYFDLVDDANDRPVILYDLATKSAWLVSVMSLALHIVLTYLSLPRIQERRSSGGKPIDSEWPQLPHASPSANGGEQARYTVLLPANYNLELWNDEDKTKKFGHVVESVLRDLSAVRKAVIEQQGDCGYSISGHGLRGWDFSVLAERKPEVIQRELLHDRHEAGWWKLEDAKGMLVIFGKSFGRVIRPAAGTDTPFGSEGIPNNARLLVASKPCIQRPFSVFKGGNRLLGQLAWRMSMEKCKRGTCGCSTIYLLESPPQNKLRKDCRTCKSNVCDGGNCLIEGILANTDGPKAFVFGDAKHYHQVLD